MSKDFKDFQKHFKKYQQRFGLTGYQVYFKHEPIENAFASISGDATDRVATVRLNSKLSKIDKPHKDIKQSAKHEAIHLLLMDVDSRARERYVTPNQIYEAVEDVVVKLQGLVPDS